MYTAFPELGGWRPARPDSHNTNWRNKSFLGYADYMETEAFRSGIARLTSLASQKSTAVMCAEALWWRCHRALIADYLKSQGAVVRHVVSLGKTEAHRYTQAARLADGKLYYSPAG